MISKIIEEALENMIRRIDKLEESVSKLTKAPSPGTPYPKNDLATSGQIWKINNEDGSPWEGMTKSEATKEIDRLLKLNKKTATGTDMRNCIIDSKIKNSKDAEKAFNESLKITEPKEVDTDDVGLDEEGLM